MASARHASKSICAIWNECLRRRLSMKNPQSEKNLRVLVIDDNESIHADFKKILTKGSGLGQAEAMEEALFGEAAEKSRAVSFEVDSAHQGQEGFEMVQRA